MTPTGPSVAPCSRTGSARRGIVARIDESAGRKRKAATRNALVQVVSQTRQLLHFPVDPLDPSTRQPRPILPCMHARRWRAIELIPDLTQGEADFLSENDKGDRMVSFAEWPHCQFDDQIRTDRFRPKFRHRIRVRSRRSDQTIALRSMFELLIQTRASMRSTQPAKINARKQTARQLAADRRP